MNRLLLMLKAFLHFVPFYQYFWFFGAFSVIGSLILSATTSVKWDWLTIFFSSSGLTLVSVIPLLAVGGVLRVWLSNHHTQLLPHFRLSALLAFAITIVLALLALLLTSFGDVFFYMDKRHWQQLLITAIVVYSVVPWTVFFVSQYRWGPLLLWLLFLLNVQWFGSVFRELMTLAQQHPLLAYGAVAGLWVLGIYHCLTRAHIAPARTWQHQINESKTPNAANFSYLTGKVNIRTPEVAMLFDGSDTLWHRFGRVALLVYIFPLVMLALVAFIDRNDPLPLFENLTKAISITVIWAFMMTTGLISVTASKLRLVWLRSTQSRPQLMRTLTRQVSNETLILMALVTPMSIYAGFYDPTQWPFVTVLFLVIGSLHWFTSMAITHYTVTCGSSWRTGFTLILGMVLLGITVLLMKIVAIYCGVIISVLSLGVATKLKQHLDEVRCYKIDLNVLRPLRLNQATATLRR